MQSNITTPVGISDEKMYEIAMNLKLGTEARRDDINKFYISLFSVVISISPFVPKIIDKTNLPFYFSMYIFIFSISIVGIFLSVSWILMLKRMSHYLGGIETYLMNLEKSNNQQLLTHVTEHLQYKGAPGRVTKQQVVIPYLFFAIFMATLGSAIAYNVYII